MVLRKCPKCREMVNCDSYSCPRCGVVFREYRTRRLIFWVVVVLAVGWVMHHTVLPHLARLHRHTSPTLTLAPADLPQQ